MKTYLIKIPIIITEYNSYLTGKTITEKTELNINLSAPSLKLAIKKLQTIIEKFDEYDGFDTDEEE